MRELVIVGGGPVGMSAALAAACHGIDTLVLEAQVSPDGRDPRVFALSHGARLILERLGAWAYVSKPHPIRAVHVSQRGAFGHTLLRAEEIGVDALGYVVSHPDLSQALRRRMNEMDVDCRSGARVVDADEQAQSTVVRFECEGREQEVAARIVAQADGATALGSPSRLTERDYGQCALVAEVRCARAEPDYAYERFTTRGPIALLPLNGHHALIWTVPEADAGRLLALDDEGFERALIASYGERIGAARLAAPRASFPLILRFAHQVAGNRIVLIGNAAQTLHPVAGQGFNMGLRDAFELAQALAECSRAHEDPLLGVRRYRSRRRLDRAGGTLFTDILVRAFSNDNPLLTAARSAGLMLLDAAGPAKKFLMRRMIFGSSG